jgi:hypothetical protein
MYPLSPWRHAAQESSSGDLSCVCSAETGVGVTIEFCFCWDKEGLYEIGGVPPWILNLDASWSWVVSFTLRLSHSPPRKQRLVRGEEGAKWAPVTGSTLYRKKQFWGKYLRGLLIVLILWSPQCIEIIVWTSDRISEYKLNVYGNTQSVNAVQGDGRHWLRRICVINTLCRHIQGCYVLEQY